MTHHVLGQEQVWVPFTLEIRIETPATLIYFVFVRVDDSQIGFVQDLLSDPKKGIFSYEVVLIQEGQPVSGRQLKRRVARSRNMSVSTPGRHTDAGFLCIFHQQLMNSNLR